MRPVDHATFDVDVVRCPLPVLVFVGAFSWDAHSKAIEPHVVALAETHSAQLAVFRLNVSVPEKFDLANALKIVNTPTFLFFRSGAMSARRVGLGGGPSGLRGWVEAQLAA